MERNRRNVRAHQSGSSPPSEAWLFAQALLGKPIPSAASAQAEARAKREQLEWLASISTRHERQLRRLQSDEAEARRKRELLQWLATFSTEHENQLRKLQAAEAEAREAQERFERFADHSNVEEANWDPSKHPRGGLSQNRGWWSPSGGSGGTSSAPSFLDAVIRRNQAIADLTGVVTPGMIRSTRIAAELQSAATLPDEVARAAAAGLGTGGKAVVNGFATAVKSAATLGLDTEQLELIGVSKEDRDRGYDTAAAISTASGQVLIAVGTGGMASALSKGGTIARAASGALVAYDAAGNAVGVVQGAVDASTKGVSLANGAQIAGGLLGISANLSATKSLAGTGTAVQPPGSKVISPQVDGPTSQFQVSKHKDMPSPRPGQNSHHGVMSEWMARHYPRYNKDNAPTVLVPETNHHATYAVYNRWRSEMRQKLGGNFDWSRITEDEMRALSERMFDAADVPPSVRQQYWAEFEK